MRQLIRYAAILVSMMVPPVAAQDIKVAVASNFAAPLRAIAASFEAQYPHRVVVIPGSTGKLYAQIVNGAPFDAFFAADTDSVERLEKNGVTVANTGFIYAQGKLVSWTAQQSKAQPDSTWLREGSFRHLAIANPRLAPYGRAARQTLQNLDLWQSLQGRLLRGENIAQTFHFVKSGNADAGLIALAQISGPQKSGEGQAWLVPEHLYTPIRQRAVLIREKAAAREFLDFCQRGDALRIIRDYGYHVPDADL